jgi:hypothetical protein
MSRERSLYSCNKNTTIIQQVSDYFFLFLQLVSWNPDVRSLPVAFHILSHNFILSNPTIYPSRQLKFSAIASTFAVEWCSYLWFTAGDPRLHVSNSHCKQPDLVTRPYAQKRHSKSQNCRSSCHAVRLAHTVCCSYIAFENDSLKFDTDTDTLCNRCQSVPITKP